MTYMTTIYTQSKEKRGSGINIAGGIRILINNTIYLVHRLTIMPARAKLCRCKEHGFFKCHEQYCRDINIVEVEIFYYCLGEWGGSECRDILGFEIVNGDPIIVAEDMLRKAFINGLLDLSGLNIVYRDNRDKCLIKGHWITDFQLLQ
ncbi:MAG: hypothetical protein GXO43_04285 [Crenarchaeota archaeon]|nr:hypothetical protein [Thermoproteota archaeon]